MKGYESHESEILNEQALPESQAVWGSAQKMEAGTENSLIPDLGANTGEEGLEHTDANHFAFTNRSHRNQKL